MRFKERLGFELEYDGDLASVMIPVFTIQPLVENAIIHGIEPKVEGGRVRIKVKMNEEKTRIIITDTGGDGMDKERLTSIMKQYKGKKSERIGGVANVYNRFKLHYGDRGEFQIHSKKGMGTSIKLTISKEVKDV